MDLSILGKEISEVKENDFFKIFSKGLKEYKAFENDIDCHYYSEENGIDFIFENNILAEGGIIISEHSIYEKMPEKIGNFVKYDERNYNKKIVTFYCYE